jgi:hypothetical protein
MPEEPKDMIGTLAESRQAAIHLRTKLVNADRGGMAARPMPFEAQGCPSGGEHREARFILTQQDQFPRLGFF